MFMIMLILNNPEYCQEMLDAWIEAGTSGVTILPSTGFGRVRDRVGLQDDLPLMPSLAEFFKQEESQHRTLITVVKDHDTVRRIVDATQTIVGDLNLPNTGILTVLPVTEAYGLDRKD